MRVSHELSLKDYDNMSILLVTLSWNVSRVELHSNMQLMEPLYISLSSKYLQTLVLDIPEKTCGPFPLLSQNSVIPRRILNELSSAAQFFPRTKSEKSRNEGLAPSHSSSSPQKECRNEPKAEEDSDRVLQVVGLVFSSGCRSKVL